MVTYFNYKNWKCYQLFAVKGKQSSPARFEVLMAVLVAIMISGTLRGIAGCAVPDIFQALPFKHQ